MAQNGARNSRASHLEHAPGKWSHQVQEVPRPFPCRLSAPPLVALWPELHRTTEYTTTGISLASHRAPCDHHHPYSQIRQHQASNLLPAVHRSSPPPSESTWSWWGRHATHRLGRIRWHGGRLRPEGEGGARYESQVTRNQGSRTVGSPSLVGNGLATPFQK